MSNEQIYYDALHRIAKKYQTPDQLRRNAEKQFGCSYEEALEMVYENLQAEAARAIHGKRRPKSPSLSRPQAESGKSEIRKVLDNIGKNAVSPEMRAALSRPERGQT